MNFSWNFSQFLACMLCLIVGVGTAPAFAVNVALVIGNSSYQSDVLPTASADATLVAEALEKRGFDVVLATDPSFFEFQKLIGNFGDRSNGAELSIFYYSGHGIVLSDNNYLIPTDIHLRSRSDYRKLPWLQEILIAGSEAQRSVTVLDTCFTSDFAKGWGERFGRGSLCPDNEPRITIGDENSVVFTRSQSGPPSSQSNDIYASTLAKELESASSLLTWLDETTRISGAQSTSANQPFFLGSRTDIAITNRAEGGSDIKENKQLASIRIESGEYELSNLFRSRKLVDDGNNVPVMGQDSGVDASAHWSVRQISASSFSMFNVATNRFLGVSDSGTMMLVDSERGAATTWTAIPVDGGLDNELHLFNEGVGQFFRASGSAGSLSIDDSPGSAGWLLEIQQQVLARAESLPQSEDTASNDSTTLVQPAVSALTVETVPEDSRVRILNILPTYADGMVLARNENYHIEVSKDGYVKDTRWVRLEEEEVVVRIELQSATEANETIVANEPALDPNSQPQTDQSVADTATISEVPALVDNVAPVPAQEPAPDNALPDNDLVDSETINGQISASDSTAQLPAEPTPVPQYSISSEDINNALGRFNEISAALRESDPEFLTSSLPVGEKRDILNQLTSQYAEIDARVITLNSDDEAQSVSATLRLMRLIKSNGDIVTPAESYRDFSLMQTRSDDGEWSEFLWTE